MAARWLNVALGTWLFLSAFIVGPSAPEFADHLVLGIAIFLLAFMAMGIPRLRYLTAVFGGWTALSPFIFHYLSAQIAFFDIVIGIVVTWAALTPPHPHHTRPAPPASA